MRSSILFLLVTLLACDKTPAPTANPEPTASATAAVTAKPPPEPPPSAAPEPAAPTVSVAAPAESAKAKDGGAPTAKSATKHVAGKNYALDLVAPACKVAEECAMTIKLVAGGGYHVNKEYPYKFLATPAPAVTFLGKADPNIFTRAAGDFVEQGETGGTMTVRFKPASAGQAKVAGKYKLSVCSADQCQIEEEIVELAVPVI